MQCSIPSFTNLRCFRWVHMWGWDMAAHPPSFDVSELNLPVLQAPFQPAFCTSASSHYLIVHASLPLLLFCLIVLLLSKPLVAAPFFSILSNVILLLPLLSTQPPPQPLFPSLLKFVTDSGHDAEPRQPQCPCSATTRTCDTTPLSVAALPHETSSSHGAWHCPIIHASPRYYSV